MDRRLNLPGICRNFPNEIQNEVNRENLVQTIGRILDNQIDFLTIEGEDGIGKTTLCAQFALTHSDHAISLFVNPVSQISINPNYVSKIIIEQILWCLDETGENSHTDENLLMLLIERLQKKAYKNREQYYFIIDGLIAESCSPAIQEMIFTQFIPLGLSGFKFIVSSSDGQIPDFIGNQLRVKSFQVPDFSLDESVKFLSDIVSKKSDRDDLFRICSGIPSKLASIKRLVAEGLDIEKILETGGESGSFIELEWKKINSASETDKQILALIAYSKRALSTVEVAKTLNFSIDQVESLSKRIAFIEEERSSGVITFVNEALRNHAKAQLSNYSTDINEVIIEAYQNDLDSIESLSFLPNHLQEAGRIDELNNILTPEYYEKLLGGTKSLYPMKGKARLGIESADKGDDFEAMMRYAIQLSVIKETELSEIWRSEIEAHLAIEDYKEGLNLASLSMLKEDKLHLLSIIAKEMVKHKKLPGKQLLNQIEVLYKSISIAELGSKAEDIASALIWVNPNMAIALIEGAYYSDEEKEKQDKAFTRLSMQAQISQRDGDQTKESLKETIQKIKDPSLADRAKSFSVFFEDVSHDQVIEKAEELEEKHKYFFLRKWLSENKTSVKSHEIINYALDTLIRQTPYLPKIKDLLDLSESLPYQEDKIELGKLIKRFDSQKGSLAGTGTSSEYVQFQMVLARAESSLDFKTAVLRIIEVYYLVSEEEDLGTRTECMAWLLSAITEIDKERELENREGLFSVIEDELLDSCIEFESIFADQMNAINGVVKALAHCNKEMAMQYIENANTRESRNGLRVVFVKEAISLDIEDLDVNGIVECLNAIVPRSSRDEALTIIVDRLKTIDVCCTDAKYTKIEPLINLLFTIYDDATRAIALSKVYVFLRNGEMPKKHSLVTKTEKSINSSWDDIDFGWYKIEVGYSIVKHIAEVDQAQAHEFMAKCKALKEKTLINTQTSRYLIMASIKLLIRVYSGLVLKNNQTQQDYEEIENAIEMNSSTFDKIYLWSELSAVMFLNGKETQGRELVNNKIIPLISTIEKTSTYRQAILTCAPALSRSNQNIANDYLSKLEPHDADMARVDEIDFIFRKILPEDPFEYVGGSGYRIDYSDAMNVIAILSDIVTDHFIYGVVVDLCESLKSAKNKHHISIVQRNDILERLEGVVREKLPDPLNIKHNGYLLVCIATILWARGEKNTTKWKKLIDDAESIPNVSDKAFVHSIISILLPYKMRAEKESTYKSALSIIEAIPSYYERAKRFIDTAEVFFVSNPNASRQCIQRSVDVMKELKVDKKTSRNQRRLLDLAYRIDPKLATTLVEKYDDDPARKHEKERMNRQLETLRIKSDSDIDDDKSKLTKKNEDVLIQGVWMKLASLNASRISNKHIREFRKYFILSSTLPLGKSYPFFAYSIQNAVLRFKDTDQANIILRSLFNSIRDSVDLSTRIFGLLSNRKPHGLSHLFENDDAMIIISAGEREKGIDYIKNWLYRNLHSKIIISDGYFSPEELDILKLISEVNPSCEVTILTSYKHLMKSGVKRPWQESFTHYWNSSISSEAPPPTEIIIVNEEPNGDYPIHDRWWISDKSGLNVGTSLNSLGHNKTSELKTLSENDTMLKLKEIQKYIDRIKTNIGNRRINYELFSM